MTEDNHNEDPPELTAEERGETQKHQIRNAGALKSYCCHDKPHASFQHCGCFALSNPWLRNKLRRQHHTLGLIAYVRTSTASDDLNQQLALIGDYCAVHGYHITKVFKDEGIPSSGLREALDSLDEAAGIIAVDLNRFVAHSSDRLRELRPLIHHFFCQSTKHLITVKEGIDTRSPGGQLAALDLIADNRDGFL